jgi:hypothetical protein
MATAQQIERAAQAIWIARRAKLALQGVTRACLPWSQEDERVKEAVRLEAAAALNSYEEAE